MSEKEQHLEGIGGLPPTIPGSAGEVDTGNGPPLPLHQDEEVITDPSTRVNLYLEEADPRTDPSTQVNLYLEEFDPRPACEQVNLYLEEADPRTDPSTQTNLYLEEVDPRPTCEQVNLYLEESDLRTEPSAQVDLYLEELDPRPACEITKGSQEEGPHEVDRPPSPPGDHSYHREGTDHLRNNDPQEDSDSLGYEIDHILKDLQVDPQEVELTIDQVLRDLQVDQQEVELTLKMVFNTRVQEEGEHVLQYVHHKLALFVVAYSQHPIPWEIYYTETTKGLWNRSVAKELSEYQPRTSGDYMDYANQLQELTDARETEFPEVKGDGGDQSRHTKDEMVHPLEARACLSCGSRGHLKFKCPSILPEPSVVNSNADGHENPSSKTMANKPQKRFIPYRFVRGFTEPIYETPKRSYKRAASTNLNKEVSDQGGAAQALQVGDPDYNISLSAPIESMGDKGTPSNVASLHAKRTKIENNSVGSFLVL